MSERFAKKRYHLSQGLGKIELTIALPEINIKPFQVTLEELDM